MFPRLFLFTASTMIGLWGIAHLFPTASIVRGFGEITADNRRILTMEWILEGVSLIWISVLIAAVTIIDIASPLSKSVCFVTAAGLLAFACVSVFTGFRIRFFAFRLCPFIFASAAILILLGGVSS